MRRFVDADPVCCAVCKRAAGANGYMPPRGKNPIAWVCDDPTCRTLLKQVYHMPVRQLSQVEAFSLADAGAAAGAYLESIGKTDLGDLDPAEWATFLKTVLTGYETAMRERLTGKAA